MPFVKIGVSYINTDDIGMINAVESGTEEDKKFGVELITRYGNLRTYCESRTARNEMIQRALDLANSENENMAEIRRQLQGINSRINSMDRKLETIRKDIGKGKA
jgi:hypothetical protein